MIYPEEVTEDSLSALLSATDAFAKAEVKRITELAIADMRRRPAHGVFGDVAARHLWDAFCWCLQEGPYDDDMGWDEVNLGSPADAFEETIGAIILGEIETLPRHVQVMLSAMAYEDADDEETGSVGNIWMDGMVGLVMDRVNEAASRQSGLDLIGPGRADALGYHVSGSGVVWSVLSDRGEAIELAAAEVDSLIDPAGDLSGLAERMLDSFFAAAQEEKDGPVMAALLDSFGLSLRRLLRENDVLPTLEDIREQIADVLDG